MEKDNFSWGQVEENKGIVFSPFGPFVYLGKLSESAFFELESRIEEVRGNESRDLGEKLAGRLVQQYDITDVCSKSIYEEIISHLKHKYTELETMTGLDYQSGINWNEIWIDSLWANIQKAGEYNPPHIHNGMYSFVIYTKIDMTREEALDNRFDKQKGQTLAGHLELRYGETAFANYNYYSHWPEIGDIIIFPSWLQHCVHSFYKEGAERISVAGNFQMGNTDAMGVIQKTNILKQD